VIDSGFCMRFESGSRHGLVVVVVLGLVVTQGSVVVVLLGLVLVVTQIVSWSAGATTPTNSTTTTVMLAVAPITAASALRSRSIGGLAG
jgi:hypothetical protein